MISDIRFSFRQILRSPGFTLIAVSTLALGIGANTAIFSMINTLILRPLPYPESDRIVQINLDPGTGFFPPASGGLFLDFENADQFESLAAIHGSNLNLTGMEEPLRLTGLDVSEDYLKTLGIKVALGKDFTRENNLPGGNKRVVILSDSLWKNQFGANPNIIDRIIKLDYQDYTVIGVLPPNALPANNIQYLVPTAIHADDWKQVRRYTYVCGVIGRLKPDANLQSAQAELTAIKSSLNNQYPDMFKEWSITVRTLQESLFGNSRPSLIILLVAVGFVLLVACANVANLLLARATARQSEMAVRSALGASGWKIARQLLCESLLLSFLGGMIGLLIAIVSLKPLTALFDLSQMPGLEFEIDVTVLLFTVGASVLTGLVFGSFPAFKTIRMGATSGLSDASRSATSASGNKIQSALIVAEVALTVTLLVSIGLLLKSSAKAFSTDPGFEQENVLTFEIARSTMIATTNEAHVQFTEQILEKINAIPGVEHAAMISTTPMNSTQFFGAPFWRDDQPDTANTYFTGFDSIYGDVFKTLGIPLLQGRIIERSDQKPDSPKVVVINEQVVEDVFEDTDPIGHMIHHDDERWEVVGVVGSINSFSLDSGQQPIVYKPEVHWPWTTSYVVRTSIDPLALANEVRMAIHEVDPDQPIDRLRTLEEAVQSSIQGRSVMITLIGLFGLIAIILATIGIYGLMTYLIEQRSREIGIRLAIGAEPKSIVQMIMKRGARLSVLGISVGAIAVLVLGQNLAFLLYQVEPYDPIVLVCVAAFTLIITIGACWQPAFLASRTSPSSTLRL